MRACVRVCMRVCVCVRACMSEKGGECRKRGDNVQKPGRMPETIRENDFLKSFGQDLAQAHRHMKEYVRLVGEGGSSVPTRPAGPVSYDASGRLSRQSEEAETAMNKAWGKKFPFCCFVFFYAVKTH